MRKVTSLLGPSIHFVSASVDRPIQVLRRIRLSAAFAEQCSQALHDPSVGHLLGDSVECALLALDALAKTAAEAFQDGVAAGSFAFTFDARTSHAVEAKACANFNSSGQVAGLSIQYTDAGWRFNADSSGAAFLLDSYRGVSMDFRRHSAACSRDPDLSPFKREVFNAALSRLRKMASIRCRADSGQFVHNYRFVFCFEPDPSIPEHCYDVLATALFDLDLRLRALSLVVPGTDWKASLGA